MNSQNPLLKDYTGDTEVQGNRLVEEQTPGAGQRRAKTEEIKYWNRSQ